jgi:hypothetical protein
MSAVRPLSGAKQTLSKPARQTRLPRKLEEHMAKATKKKRPRGAAWTKAMHSELRKHSKAKTPVEKISKQMKRSVGALRQQALKLGIGLGHRR